MNDTSSRLEVLSNSRVINSIKQSLDSSIENNTLVNLGNWNFADPKIIMHAFEEYFNQLKSKRSLQDYTTDKVSELVDWKMNKWGDIEFLHKKFKDGVPELTWCVDAYSIKRNTRLSPRRKKRINARKRIGNIEIHFTFYPVEPVKYISASFTLDLENNTETEKEST